jgi:hypothetical protein
MEDSVALALQSCLGGRALDFHVKFLSNNHFRFSVFSKEVGFHIYKLRRITTAYFDVYFHLWNNGVPHWEREKRVWEIEQEKEWNLVLSISAKEARKKKNLKRVHFAKPIVQPPPKVKHQPVISIVFGSFPAQIVPSTTSGRSVFGSPPILRCHPDGNSNKPTITAPSKAQSNGPVPNSNSIPKPVGRSLRCFRCLELGHTRRFCLSKVRCSLCFDLGHIKRRCPAKVRPKPIWVWMPKARSTDAEPQLTWRPKIPIQSNSEASSGKTPPSCTHNLDSRATTADSSASHNLEQDQFVLQSHTNPPANGQLSDAISIPNNERACFLAARSRCATITLFHRKSLPSIFHAGPSTIAIQPILIDRTLVDEHGPAPTGLEIVLRRPVLDALALQIWPAVLAATNKTKSVISSPPLIIEEDGVVLNMHSGPDNFQIQAEQMRPSPAEPDSQKGKMVRLKRKSMALPDVASVSDARTPLVERSVRRSSRLSIGNEGSAR